MRRLTITIFLLLVTAYANGILASDEKGPDSLLISSAKIAPGGSAPIRIDFVNDQELAAIQVPIRVQGGLLIDSVSFANSRVDYLGTKEDTISADRQMVFLGTICITEAYIQPGRGQFVTIYVSCPDSVSEAVLPVDTTQFDDSSLRSLLFVNKNSSDFVPKVQPGSISVVADK